MARDGGRTTECRECNGSGQHWHRPWVACPNCKGIGHMPTDRADTSAPVSANGGREVARQEVGE